MQKLFLISILLLISSLVFADKFTGNASYRVCFTPAENCTDSIVDAINRAQKQVLVQAYSFTSKPIAKALVQAHKRGVKVEIILDKSQTRQHGFSSAKLFSDYRIPVMIDYKPSIAHNKIMIIDAATVITGSFNFTKAAEQRNAENVLIISDIDLAKKYSHNWQLRAKESEVMENTNSPFGS